MVVLLPETPKNILLLTLSIGYSSIFEWINHPLLSIIEGVFIHPPFLLVIIFIFFFFLLLLLLLLVLILTILICKGVLLLKEAGRCATLLYLWLIKPPSKTTPTCRMSKITENILLLLMLGCLEKFLVLVSCKVLRLR